LGLTSRGPVAQAVARSAEVRAALDHPAGDVRPRATDVVARLRCLDARVARWRAARARGRVSPCAARRVVVAGPLPDVAGHVEQPVAVRGEQSDGCRAAPSLRAGVAPRKAALPEIRHQLAAGRLLVAPGENCELESASRGILPF